MFTFKELSLVLLGAVIGSILGFVGSLYVQNRGYRKLEENNNSQLKLMLIVLRDDLGFAYSKLFSSPNGWAITSVLNFLSNYEFFDFSNKNAIWPQIVSHNVFTTNKDLFEKINLITQKMHTLNMQVELLLPERWRHTEEHKDVKKAKDIMESIRRIYDSNIQTHKEFENTSLYQALSSAIQSLEK